jgi:hypothetical protein
MRFSVGVGSGEFCLRPLAATAATGFGSKGARMPNDSIRRQGRGLYGSEAYDWRAPPAPVAPYSDRAEGREAPQFGSPWGPGERPVGAARLGVLKLAR